MGRWQDMDLEELEEQYSPSRWSRRMDSESVIQAHIDVTTAALQERRRPGLLHIPCCTSPMEMGMGRSLTFIFLRTLLKVGDEHSDRGAEVMPMCLPVLCCAAFPVFVYIHGGYWQCLSKDASGFAAPALLSQGVAVVALGYDIAPKGRQGPTGVMTSFGGSVPTWLCTLPRPHGCDGAPGAAQPCLPGEAIPQDQELFWEVAQRNSPILCVTQAVPVAASCEVLVAVAQHDSPEFRRQSQEYSQALRSAGWSVSLLDLASVDHFDIIEKLSEETYVLTQVILNMIARS
ncbi:kynurenine formamidase isoform X8 [Gallus gallus]|uniref:kynurenine formamidase isoform X8 n=1 Tax=Gallus gallus TaxID=9031 RepID=UPI001AE12C19|nr:kynurenine formamidase isoform X8 [Gallus gallus]